MCLWGYSSSAPSSVRPLCVRGSILLSVRSVIPWLTCVLTRLLDRGGAAVVRSDQRWNNTVQAHHSRWGRVLELPGCARHPCRPLHLARLLPEKAAAETWVELFKHLSISFAGWSWRLLCPAQEQAAVAAFASVSSAAAGVPYVGKS